MPVSPAFAESNRSQTERLRRVVGRLDAALLAVRLPNGWTVAGALAHLAFWDRQRLCLMRRWAARDFCSGAYDGDLFNSALQPLLELIPPERAAAAAVQAAEEIDALLLEVSDELVAAALARPDAPNLDRGSHRGYHLDQIEQAFVDSDIEARLVVKCEAVADARRETLGDFRLQEHVGFRPPQKSKVGRYCPFRAVVRLQHASHFK